MSSDKHLTGSLLAALEALQSEEDFDRIVRGIFDLDENVTHIGMVDSNGLSLHSRLRKSFSPRTEEKTHRDLGAVLPVVVRALNSMSKITGPFRIANMTFEKMQVGMVEGGGRVVILLFDPKPRSVVGVPTEQPVNIPEVLVESE
jgi:hypothetical protein